ncbi:MAG: MATE family efflux transporter [Oscillospiraceae bacterium]|nr:MATE family efflux transporter [Oscillospiraceae bacterium]
MFKKLVRSEQWPAYKFAFAMAWPAVVESFFVAFAGLVDSLMVSRLNSTAVAAVSLTTQPKFISYCFFIALNVAVSALVARRRGEGDQRAANRVLITALCVALFMGCVISLVCVFGAETIMGWAGANQDTLADSALYFRIICGGMLFNVLFLTINASQRGSGNTRVAMWANVTGQLVNICGNYLLIEGHFGFPALGVKGAALATVFGTAVAFAIALVNLCRPGGFVSLPYLLKNRVRPRMYTFKNLARMASGVLTEQLLMRIGFMLTALMVADLGTDAFAAHGVGMNLLALSFSFGDGMQAAAVALIGRSLGENRPDKAMEYGYACQRIGLCISLCILCIYFLGGRALYGLFFTEAHIVEYGVQILRVLSLAVLAQISGVIFIGSLRGAGDVVYTTIASTVSVTVVRVCVGYFCCYILNWGLVGLWVGIFSDQACRLIFGFLRFRTGKWTQLKI